MRLITAVVFFLAALSAFPDSYHKSRFVFSQGDPFENLEKLLQDMPEEQSDEVFQAFGKIILILGNSQDELTAALDGKTPAEIVELAKDLEATGKYDDKIQEIVTRVVVKAIQQYGLSEKSPEEADDALALAYGKITLALDAEEWTAALDGKTPAEIIELADELEKGGILDEKINYILGKSIKPGFLEKAETEFNLKLSGDKSGETRNALSLALLKIIITTGNNQDDLTAALNGKTSAEIFELANDLETSGKFDARKGEFLKPVFIGVGRKYYDFSQNRIAYILKNVTPFKELYLIFGIILHWIIHIFIVSIISGYSMFWRGTNIWSIMSEWIRSVSRMSKRYLWLFISAIIVSALLVVNFLNMDKLTTLSNVTYLISFVLSMLIIVNQLAWSNRRILALPLIILFIVQYFRFAGFSGITIGMFPYPWVWNIVWDRAIKDKKTRNHKLPKGY